ncbi:MAG: hypothetical protein JXA25_06240, partial [Anaerolineales bacterium]|nr:hypothetical protein [Anaerolineales bacterium]
APLIYRQGIYPFDHFFELGSFMRPSATDKKSFSIASCPILAWNSLISGLAAGFLPLAKTCSASASSFFFHCVICLGCTSNRTASSDRVCYPLIASSPAFALNAAPVCSAFQNIHFLIFLVEPLPGKLAMRTLERYEKVIVCIVEITYIDYKDIL